MKTGIARTASVALVLVVLLAQFPVPSASVQGATPPLQVSITASPASPLVGQAVTLSANISNAPSGSGPSYNWELDLGGSWHSFGSGPTFSYLIAQPESQAFRVTVTYGSGASASSDDHRYVVRTDSRTYTRADP